MLSRKAARRLVLPALVTLGLVLALLTAPSLATSLTPLPASRLPDAGAVSSSGPLPRPERRPNIVVVMADDMRADDLRFAPNVRRLVGKHGLNFQNSFSPYPLCCPARTSFLTGMYAHNHKVYWHEAPYGYGAFDDSHTLATSLKAAGYTTGYIGKYLNRYGPARSLVSAKPSYNYVPRGWTDWRATIDHPGVAGIHGGTYNYMDTPFNVNGRVDNSHRGRYQSYVIGDFSVDMARSFARRDAPFFMSVNYLAPHFGGPYEKGDPASFITDSKGNPQDFRTPARPAWVRGKFDTLITRGAGIPKVGGRAEPRIGDKPRAFRKLPPLSRRELRAVRDLTRQRAESVVVMDRQIQRLVVELKKSGEWANTVFMFTSDNGYYLGEHRRRSGKVRAHEPSLRVPFLVTGPGLRSGQDRYDPISTIDVSASILDLAGARAPHRADGVSRVPTMSQGDQGWTAPILDEATHGDGRRVASPGFRGPRTSIGIRTARFSYIRNHTNEHELYDLRFDPTQETNVYGRPQYAAIERALHRVWWRTKDCVGRECQVALPRSLRATPRQQSLITRSYWRSIRKVYGF